MLEKKIFRIFIKKFFFTKKIFFLQNFFFFSFRTAPFQKKLTFFQIERKLNLFGYLVLPFCLRPLPSLTLPFVCIQGACPSGEHPGQKGEALFIVKAGYSFI